VIELFWAAFGFGFRPPPDDLTGALIVNDLIKKQTKNVQKIFLISHTKK